MQIAKYRKYFLKVHKVKCSLKVKGYIYTLKIAYNT